MVPCRAVLNDSLLTEACLLCSPEAIALGCISLVRFPVIAQCNLQHGHALCGGVLSMHCWERSRAHMLQLSGSYESPYRLYYNLMLGCMHGRSRNAMHLPSVATSQVGS